MPTDSAHPRPKKRARLEQSVETGVSGGSNTSIDISVSVQETAAASREPLPSTSALEETKVSGKLPKTPIQCPECAKAYTSKRRWELHIAKHRASSRVPCPFCGKLLRRHKTSKHGQRGSLVGAEKHWTTLKCRKAQAKVEYERRRGPLSPGKKLPFYIGPSNKKRPSLARALSKTKHAFPSDAHVAEINKAAEQARRRFLGSAKNQCGTLSFEIHASRQLPPFVKEWLPEERDRFFFALARFSRLQPDLIAEHVGTRTLAEIEAYLQLLASHAAAVRPIARADIPSAFEVSESWVLYEERQSASIASDERRRERKDTSATAMLSWRQLCLLGDDNAAEYEDWPPSQFFGDKGAALAEVGSNNGEGSSEDHRDEGGGHDEDSDSSDSSVLEDEADATEGLQEPGHQDTLIVESHDAAFARAQKVLERDKVKPKHLGDAGNLFDLHALGALIDACFFVHGDIGPRFHDGHISKASLLLLDKLVRAHVRDLLIRIARVAEIRHAGSPSTSELVKITQEVVRQPNLSGPRDTMNALLSLRTQMAARAQLLPRPKLSPLYAKCPKCEKWLFALDVDSKYHELQRSGLQPDWLDKHLETCVDAKKLDVASLLPLPTPLYSSIFSSGLQAAYTTHAPPAALPAGAIALPHVFRPEPVQSHAASFDDLELDLQELDEKAEQDERWEEVHLQYRDRCRDAEEEARLWKELADEANHAVPQPRAPREWLDEAEGTAARISKKPQKKSAAPVKKSEASAQPAAKPVRADKAKSVPTKQIKSKEIIDSSDEMLSD